MNPRNFRIKQVDEQLEEAFQRRSSIIKEVQAGCEHRDVGETNEMVDTYSLKYGRVCLDCGLKAEANSVQGWGVLSRPLAYKISTDQYYKLTRRV